MRSEFALNKRLIYLNSANLSISPKVVRQAVTHYGEAFERNPTAGLSEAWGTLWKVQKDLAAFLGANVFDLFLRTNVTAVLNTFLLGVPLPADAEILVGELEYGAIVNVCQWRAERDKLSWRMLRMPATPVALNTLTAEDFLASVVSQLGPKTKLVLLSHVLGGTGLIVPLEALARETRTRGIYLVVDGAYAPGAIPVDFSRLDDVDFYGCSLYKWMMGPKGTAFGWVNSRHQSAIVPTSAGWSTYQTFGPLSAFGESNRFQEAFLMPGCHDFSPFFAIKETLAFWRAQTPDKIRERLRYLGEYLHAKMQETLGWVPLAAKDRSLRGPIHAFLLPAEWQKEGAAFSRSLLQRFSVQANAFQLRGHWYAVFSPHIYNTEQEIDETMSRLQRWHS